MKLIFAERLGPWLARHPKALDWVWRVEAWLVRGLIRLFQGLGPERSAALGAWLLRTFGPKARKKQPVVEATLRRVTPELTEGERRAVLRASWESTGAVFAEYAHLEALAKPDRLTLVDQADLPALLEAKRGIIFVGAHYGNWEVLAMAASRAGCPMRAVYAPLQNPYLDALLSQARASFGAETLPRGAPLRPMLRHLRSGGATGLLLDIRVPEGVPVSFFGAPTHFSATPARLAQRTGAAIVPLWAERVAPARYRVTFEAPLFVEAGEGSLIQVTEALTARCEAWIRHDPSQWLLANRRWDKATLATF